MAVFNKNLRKNTFYWINRKKKPFPARKKAMKIKFVGTF